MTNQKMALVDFVFGNQCAFPYSTNDLSELINVMPCCKNYEPRNE
jgi:hypothetical protein